MTNTLSIRRRLIGSALRRYREGLGYDLGVPARILECHPSKISRIETGQRGIRPKELRELLTEYGADAGARDALAAIARRTSDPGWRPGHDQVPGSAYAEFLDIEKAASAILAYAPVQVPRLLQTPDYARAVISADPDVPEHARAAQAAAELARQQATLHEHRTGLAAVIGEAALRQHVGSTEVTRAQLRYLAEVSASCPDVSIRILPFAAGEHAGSSAGVLDPPVQPGTVARARPRRRAGRRHLPRHPRSRRRLHQDIHPPTARLPHQPGISGQAQRRGTGARGMSDDAKRYSDPGIGYLLVMRREPGGTLMTPVVLSGSPVRASCD